MAVKKCTKCGEVRDMSRFHADARYKDGYNGWCRDCLSKHHVDYQRKRNGITPEMYQAMFDEQGGRCAVCGVHNDDCKRGLAADHDHNTGDFRGLLCGRCNMGLGYFMDDVRLLEAATKYLGGERCTIDNEDLILVEWGES